MGFKFAVLGAGRQGTAAAYDLVTRGDADSVTLADIDLRGARRAALRVNRLSGRKVATPMHVDVTNTDSVLRVLKGIDAFVSGVPYRHNLALARLALRAKAGMVDFGGNTAIVQKQLALDGRARRAGVAIVPDCGMGPGANLNLAVHAMSLLDEPEEVRVYDGGLPERPVPPWDYELTFHVEGLTNEYAGRAVFLREGALVEVPTLTEPEEIEIPPLGRLEALVTSGGLSTMPWTYRGKLRTLENKTLRYPGHWAKIRAFAELGLFSDRPVVIGGKKVVPREVFHALFAPQVTPAQPRDLAVIHVVARGRDGDRPREAIVQLLDRHDEATGFSAMERVTGWHAAIVAEMVARGEIPPGAHAVDRAVPAGRFVEEARRRGLSIITHVE